MVRNSPYLDSQLLHGAHLINSIHSAQLLLAVVSMSDVSPESTSDSNTDSNTEEICFTDRASDVMGKANDILGKVDWTQMGKYGKAAGILAVVIVAQILIKVVIDTINFFPVVPGLLELLGVGCGGEVCARKFHNSRFFTK